MGLFGGRGGGGCVRGGGGCAECVYAFAGAICRTGSEAASMRVLWDACACVMRDWSIAKGGICGGGG